MVEKSPGKKLEPVHETKETVAFLGVELPKAKNRENAPKLEQFQDYVYDAFSLELLKKIAISLRQGDPVLIEGGTSIGKTTAVRLLCARGGYEVHYVNLNGATDIEDLMGRYIPNHERRSSTDPEYVFADGKVTSGLRQEEGKIKVIVLDEFGAAAPNISIRLHEVIDALERGGEVVLSEDASERLVVDKGKTKVVALTNPPGRGYLQREPLDPAQLRRWVYLKEPNELPDDTLTHSTRALFSLEPKTQAVQESAYLLPNERALTPEQLKEIPGIDVILEKYLEFHRGAKQLLAGRHIAADQPQRFSFDDREEPKRVRDFIAAFYRGDINETVQTALRYYYAGKLLSDEDKDKLEELIRTVEYVPVAGESKRKALKSNDGNPDQSVTFDAEAETVPGAATLEEAERILGKDVLGPKDIEQIFGAKIERVPSIPFSRAELETARELGQILVLRTDKIAKGKPMSMEAMHDQLSERWRKAKKGGLLNTADGWKGFVKDAYSKDAPRAGWALVSKEVLPDSLSKNYIEQTEVLIAHLKNAVFKGMKLPENYRKAIAEFESQKTELTRLMSSNWREAAKRLAELEITKLTRSTLQETIYDAAMYFGKTGERLLPNRYNWTSTRDPGGRLVLVGDFGGSGLSGNGHAPDFRGVILGVSLSRT